MQKNPPLMSEFKCTRAAAAQCTFNSLAYYVEIMRNSEVEEFKSAEKQRTFVSQHFIPREENTLK